MKEILIAVKNKIAMNLGNATYVCDNSDYKVVFEFDAEWEDHPVKTARFKYNGMYQEVVFTGSVCDMPVIRDARLISIGVYAGNLQTSTPAVVHAYHSILSGDAAHVAPEEDVYHQLVALVESGVLKGPDGKSAYELAVENGYIGRETDWLASLHGAPGKTPEYGVDYGTPEQIAGIANQAADVLRSDVNQLKKDLADLDLTSIKNYPLYKGNATGSVWNNVNDNYQHILVPINDGDRIELTVESNLYYGILKTYTEAVDGDSVPYSEDVNWNTRKIISKSVHFISFVAPNDAMYLLLQVKHSIFCYPISLIINGIEYADSAKKTIYNAINRVNENVESSGIVPFANRKQYLGFIGKANRWINFDGSYGLKVIPCKAGAQFTINAGALTDTYYGALKAFNGVISNDIIPFSDETGWTTRKSVSANGSVSGVLPSDAKYLVVVTLYRNVSSVPTKLVVDGIDYLKTVYENAIEVASGLVDEAVSHIVSDGLKKTVSWEAGTFSQTIGEQSRPVGSTARIRMSNAVKYGYPITIETDGIFSFFLATYDDDLLLLTKSEYSTDVKYVPENTYFRIILADSLDNTTDISAYTSDDIHEHITIKYDQLAKMINQSVSWCAMGDSITEGYVSFFGADGGVASSVQKDKAWAYKVAAINRWHLTNIGIGGTGWNKATNSQVKEGIDTTSAHYVARHTDFSGYNLVTLAYGINDWKGNRPTGSIDDDVANPTTTISGMRATIEAIMESNPNCKIIVILPLNCAGYGFIYEGDNRNWALDYRYVNSGTLEEFVQKLIEVCDYYGIQYIDQTHYSCINRLNMRSCLPDGVHPSKEIHDLLARELSKKITF